jgi:hypothetical protein
MGDSSADEARLLDIEATLEADVMKINKVLIKAKKACSETLDKVTKMIIHIDDSTTDRLDAVNIQECAVKRRLYVKLSLLGQKLGTVAATQRVLDDIMLMGVPVYVDGDDGEGEDSPAAEVTPHPRVESFSTDSYSTGTACVDGSLPPTPAPHSGHKEHTSWRRGTGSEPMETDYTGDQDQASGRHAHHPHTHPSSHPSLHQTSSHSAPPTGDGYSHRHNERYNETEEEAVPGSSSKQAKVSRQHHTREHAAGNSHSHPRETRMPHVGELVRYSEHPGATGLRATIMSTFNDSCVIQIVSTRNIKQVPYSSLSFI